MIFAIYRNNYTFRVILKVCAPFKGEHSGGCFRSLEGLDALDFIGPEESVTPLSAVGFSAALSKVVLQSSAKDVKSFGSLGIYRMRETCTWEDLLTAKISVCSIQMVIWTS